MTSSGGYTPGQNNLPSNSKDGNDLDSSGLSPPSSSIPKTPFPEMLGPSTLAPKMLPPKVTLNKEPLEVTQNKMGNILDHFYTNSRDYTKPVTMGDYRDPFIPKSIRDEAAKTELNQPSTDEEAIQVLIKLANPDFEEPDSKNPIPEKKIKPAKKVANVRQPRRRNPQPKENIAASASQARGRVQARAQSTAVLKASLSRAVTQPAPIPAIVPPRESPQMTLMSDLLARPSTPTTLMPTAEHPQVQVLPAIIPKPIPPQANTQLVQVPNAASASQPKFQRRRTQSHTQPVRIQPSRDILGTSYTPYQLPVPLKSPPKKGRVQEAPSQMAKSTTETAKYEKSSGRALYLKADERDESDNHTEVPQNIKRQMLESGWQYLDETNRSFIYSHLISDPEIRRATKYEHIHVAVAKMDNACVDRCYDFTITQATESLRCAQQEATLASFGFRSDSIEQRIRRMELFVGRPTREAQNQPRLTPAESPSDGPIPRPREQGSGAAPWNRFAMSAEPLVHVPTDSEPLRRIAQFSPSSPTVKKAFLRNRAEKQPSLGLDQEAETQAGNISASANPNLAGQEGRKALIRNRSRNVSIQASAAKAPHDAELSSDEDSDATIRPFKVPGPNTRRGKSLANRKSPYHRRPKQRDTEKIYYCQYPLCDKGYSRLGSLNKHSRIKGHGDAFTKLSYNALVATNEKEVDTEFEDDGGEGSEVEVAAKKSPMRKGTRRQDRAYAAGVAVDGEKEDVVAAENSSTLRDPKHQHGASLAGGNEDNGDELVLDRGRATQRQGFQFRSPDHPQHAPLYQSRDGGDCFERDFSETAAGIGAWGGEGESLDDEDMILDDDEDEDLPTEAVLYQGTVWETTAPRERLSAAAGKHPATVGSAVDGTIGGEGVLRGWSLNDDSTMLTKVFIYQGVVWNTVTPYRGSATDHGGNEVAGNKSMEDAGNNSVDGVKTILDKDGQREVIHQNAESDHVDGSQDGDGQPVQRSKAISSEDRDIINRFAENPEDQNLALRFNAIMNARLDDDSSEDGTDDEEDSLGVTIVDRDSKVN